MGKGRIGGCGVAFGGGGGGGLVSASSFGGVVVVVVSGVRLGSVLGGVTGSFVAIERCSLLVLLSLSALMGAARRAVTRMVLSLVVLAAS